MPGGCTMTCGSSGTACSSAGRCRRSWSRDHLGERPRRAHRGPSAGVLDVRRDDPEGPVRRRRGRSVSDNGTNEAEKFRDQSKGHYDASGGKRISGWGTLIQTEGYEWLAHRMKEQESPTAKDLAPMLATLGSVHRSLKKIEWAFEGKWDTGYRLLLEADDGRMPPTVRAAAATSRVSTPDFQSRVADAFGGPSCRVRRRGRRAGRIWGAVASARCRSGARDPNRVLGVRHTAALTVDRCSKAKYRDRRRVSWRRWRRDQPAHRPRPVARGRAGGTRGVRQAAVGGRRCQAMGLHLPTGAALVARGSRRRTGTPQEVVIGGWRGGQRRPHQSNRRITHGRTRTAADCDSSAASAPASARRNSPG